MQLLIISNPQCYNRIISIIIYYSMYRKSNIIGIIYPMQAYLYQYILCKPNYVLRRGLLSAAFFISS